VIGGTPNISIMATSSLGWESAFPRWHGSDTDPDWSRRISVCAVDVARLGKVPPVADAPIGIFDSGFGGLTVARAIIDQLPREPVLYLGDTARQPYGLKPIAQVRRYALECLDDLVGSGVKMLVIACNSASAAVLRDARERYPVPVVEVIKPAVRRAVKTTRNDRVGVISTPATKTSLAYEDAFAAAPHVTLTTQACPRFVEFVERGITTGDELLKLAHDYLDPVVAASVDTLILGCTHYPLLTGVISYVMGADVALVSSAEETAQDVYRALLEYGLQRRDGLPEPQHRFLTTGDPVEFKQLAHRFLGPEVSGVEPAA
jgi:glutamate racemase